MLIFLVVAIAAIAPAFGAEFHAPAIPPRAHYQIDCSINPDAGFVSGKETITLRNPGPLSITRVAFDWPRDGNHNLKATSSGRALQPVEGGDIALFDLPEPLAAREEIQIRVEFAARVARQEGVRLLIRWHPRLWWEVNSVDNYDVRIGLPDGYAVGTSGRYDSKKGLWHVAGAQSFGIAFGKGMAAMDASTGDVMVRVFHSPEGIECARVIRDTAVDAIQYYRKRFGFYPYSSLTIVPGDRRPVGGYPVATSLVAIHGMEQFAQMPLTHWRWITAHEIAHQYWMEYVLSKDPEPLDWLLVGLGIYSDREYSYSRGISDQHAKFAEKYVAGVREGLDTNVAPAADQMRSVGFDFNNIVRHGKGFSIVSSLAAVLGNEVFGRICTKVLKEYGGRRLGVNEFQSVAEQESGQSLEWFFSQWIPSGRFASYRIAGQDCAKGNKGYRCAVQVESQGTIRMPVPLAATFEDGSRQLAWTDRFLSSQTVEFLAASPLREARLDPKGEVPLVVPPPEPKRRARPMSAASIAASLNDLPWANNTCACAALDLFHSAKTAKITGNLDWFKLGLTLYDGGYYEEALEAFSNLLPPKAGIGTGEFGAYVWQGQLLDLLGRRAEAISSYRKALAAWSGRPMHHDQYDMVLDRDWVEMRLKEPFVRR